MLRRRGKNGEGGKRRRKDWWKQWPLRHCQQFTARTLPAGTPHARAKSFSDPKKSFELAVYVLIFQPNIKNSLSIIMLVLNMCISDPSLPPTAHDCPTWQELPLLEAASSVPVGSTYRPLAARYSNITGVGSFSCGPTLSTLFCVCLSALYFLHDL